METISFDKDKLEKKLPQNYNFIGYASFEERSTTIPLLIDPQRIESSIVFYSKGYDNEKSKSDIKKHFSDKYKDVELDINSCVDTARTLTNEFRGILKDNMNLVIDVTTFTHETLLMLLKLVMDNETRINSIFCLYNGADKYSNFDDRPKDVWLSKGCKDVRNVIGYPGLMLPSKKKSLVLLTGFELERATRLIELFEPDKLYLGRGEDPISDNNKVLMQFFSERFDEWKNSFKNIECVDFTFSCKSVEKTYDVLTDLTGKNMNENYIIVPLNTKLSTISTSLLALQNKKIQVCYSVPEMYNTSNYSTPSDKITLVKLP